ncbi:DoxX family protein [Sutcliffiella halmapala]|uniref:DoxX family protein n=1 Tax=Sutcliffiella halmapala TaxID=79882 RepID=UPI000994E3C4|nr:DoxX family protein [Sutcliffiella halmapala]
MLSIGLLLIRIVVGLTFMAHGAQKLFGWFGGHGIQGTGGFFESIGIKPGKPMAAAAGLSEFIGGLLLVVGLFTPFAGIILAGTMIVAIFKVHAANGFWATSGGYEYNLILLVVAIAFAFMGAGNYAIDALFF